VSIRYAAPGRINLIGEHTDYNLGWALPIALPQRTVVTFEPSDASVITVRSDRADGSVHIPLRTKPGEVTGWAGYVAGVVWALRMAGHPVPGGSMSITSDVEMGSGLSSSAALECAALGAFVTAAGWRIDRLQQARLAQRAENEYVGAPTGLLDQLSSLFGAEASALLIDFRKLTVEPVAFDPASAGVALLLIDSRERHGHAGGEYAARRLSCERAAADVGVVSLRELQERGLSVLDSVTDAVDARRAHHVLTENQRVFDFVAALGASDYVAAGSIFSASHASMRDYFEITTPNIELIAGAAVEAGALGARMTGGGFGGCVIALAPADRAKAVVGAVRDAALAAGYAEPVISEARAARGAGVVTFAT
jgi:galactokinase